MSRPDHQPDTRTVPTVDLSPFTSEERSALPSSQHLSTARSLVEALHSFGFVKVKGHGFSKHEIDEALSWSAKLFNLPYEDKMKAPHPPGPMPHRGYSAIGTEKVYSKADVQSIGGDSDVGQQLRLISDFKVLSKPLAVWLLLLPLTYAHQ
jgi:isopenicillin N synthase-like dioxygenase